jgi:hypothetical protein
MTRIIKHTSNLQNYQSALPVWLVCMQTERTIRSAQTVLLGTNSRFRGKKNVTPVLSTHTIPSQAGSQNGAFICLRSCCSLPVDVFAVLTAPSLALSLSPPPSLSSLSQLRLPNGQNDRRGQMFRMQSWRVRLWCKSTW